MEYIAIAVILLSSAADALRDAWMRSEGWWKRHAVKWVAFYSPLVFITVVHLRIEIWIPLCIASWIIWRLSVTHIGGKEWESMWSRWLRDLFR
jgi:hypothetical protein